MKQAICSKCGKDQGHQVPDDAENLICSNCDSADHHDTLMAVCSRLTVFERATIVENFVKINRHWNGAQVEDIIDTLDDHDSYCSEIEAAYEQFPTLHQRDGFRIAVICLLVMRTELSEDHIRRLIIA